MLPGVVQRERELVDCGRCGTDSAVTRLFAADARCQVQITTRLIRCRQKMGVKMSCEEKTRA